MKTPTVKLKNCFTCKKLFVSHKKGYLNWQIDCVECRKDYRRKKNAIRAFKFGVI